MKIPGWPTPPMNPEIKARWVQALRSGEYRQGRGALLHAHSGTPKYCCLGVLCEIAVQDGVIASAGPTSNPSGALGYGAGLETGQLPAEVAAWAGLGNDYNPVILWGGTGPGSSADLRSLAALNDSTANFNFRQIADLIEEHL